jgi:hypothetical protein
MWRRVRIKQAFILLVAPFSPDSIFLTCDRNLDLRFVLILNYKHVRTAGLRVQDQGGITKTRLQTVPVFNKHTGPGRNNQNKAPEKKLKKV